MRSCVSRNFEVSFHSQKTHIMKRVMNSLLARVHAQQRQLECQRRPANILVLTVLANSREAL